MTSYSPLQVRRIVDAIDSLRSDMGEIAVALDDLEEALEQVSALAMVPVRTPDEIDSLPDGTAIVDADGVVWQRHGREVIPADDESAWLMLPARVIHYPGVGQ